MKKDKDPHIETIAKELLKTTMRNFDSITVNPKRSYHVIVVVAGVADEPKPGTETIEVEMTTAAMRHGVDHDHDHAKATGIILLEQAIESLRSTEDSDFESTMNSLILAEKAGISDQCRSIGGIKNSGKKKGSDRN